MVKGRRIAGIAILGLLYASILAGCGAVATRTKFYKPISADLVAGNYDRAARSFEKAKLDHKDRFLYYIDSGALYHYASDYDTSNVRLTQAENAAEELFTKSISRAAASMLLNDNVLEYSGEDYEILYANLIKALNYLELENFDDAFVEIRRSNLRLQLLEQKYGAAAARLNRGEANDTSGAKIKYEPGEVRFNNDALARYLSMHMYAAEGKWDDARIDYDFLVDAFKSQPNIYDFEMPNVTYAADSGAILSVVGLVGLCPVKEALNLRIRTDKDLGLVQVLYTDSDNNDVEYGHLPWPVTADYYFKFAIPKMVIRPSYISSVKVWADDYYLGEVNLIEDVGKIARETFNAKKNFIYLRSVARAVAKGLATHKLKKKADTGGVGGWLKKAAIDVGSDISENADLRCAHFLPGWIFATDFVIQPGTYDLTVKFIDLNGKIIETERISDYVVKSGEFNLLRVMSAE
jgi:hypothetical protein